MGPHIHKILMKKNKDYEYRIPPKIKISASMWLLFILTASINLNFNVRDVTNISVESCDT